MTKFIMQQALESIEAHAAHTISLIESNEMNVMTLYFRIESIQKAARNALNATKKEEEEVDPNHRLHRAAPEMYRILKEMYFDPESPTKAWYSLILGIIEDVEGVEK